MAFLICMQRDERFFERPLDFVPERWLDGSTMRMDASAPWSATILGLEERLHAFEKKMKATERDVRRLSGSPPAAVEALVEVSRRGMMTLCQKRPR